MTFVTRRLGVFDAGIGGFPVAARLLALDPRVELVYLGDAARRPYGPQPLHDVRRYTDEAGAFFAAVGCDAWVVACYTASVAVHGHPPPGDLPRVDMVQAADRALRDRPDLRTTAVMATDATVRSGRLPRHLPVDVVQQLPTEALLRLAEEDGGSDPRALQQEIDAALRQVEPGADSVLLACTDFTCILPQLRAAAPDRTFLDPIDMAATLTLESARTGGSSRRAQPELHLTGPHVVDVLGAARRWGLPFDEVRLTSLPRTQKEGCR